MINKYELISFGISVDICENEKEAITNYIADLYKRTSATKGRLHDLRLYCNRQLLISLPDLEIEHYVNQVDTIYNTIEMKEMECTKKTNVCMNKPTFPLEYLKVE